MTSRNVCVRGRLISSPSHINRAVNVRVGGGRAATTFRRYFLKSTTK